MLKILACDCKISEVEQREVQYSYTSNSFKCLCELPKHTVVATICPYHYLNLTGVPRNYFASVNCSRIKTNRNEVCKHCRYLKMALNWHVPKICVE